MTLASTIAPDRGRHSDGPVFVLSDAPARTFTFKEAKMNGLFAATGAHEHSIPLVATIADYIKDIGLWKFWHVVHVDGDERCRRDWPP